MKRLALALFAALAFAADPAMAQPGGSAILSDGRAVPIADLGFDAFRFSSAPARGGRGFIFEAARVRRDRITAHIRYYRGHPRLGRQADGERAFQLSPADYRQLVAGVDAALNRGVPTASDDSELIVCTDGPGYFTERKNGMSSLTLSGFCGRDHPNEVIAALVRRIIDTTGQ